MKQRIGRYTQGDLEPIRIYKLQGIRSAVRYSRRHYYWLGQVSKIRGCQITMLRLRHQRKRSVCARMHAMTAALGLLRFGVCRAQGARTGGSADRSCQQRNRQHAGARCSEISIHSFSLSHQVHSRFDARIRKCNTERRRAIANSLVGLGGVEPPTRSLGNCCSIHLSYSPTPVSVYHQPDA